MGQALERQSVIASLLAAVCDTVNSVMAEQGRKEIETFLLTLPDAEAARVFLQRLEAEQPVRAARCWRNSILLLRLLTIAAYSPFLAEHLLRYPDDLDWFEREHERGLDYVKATEQMAEDLSRFLTRMYNTEARTLLLRFRNRELLRIYLRDCLGLATLSEVTEELSNLADVIIGYALKQATQEVTNKYGAPQVRDERGRISQSQFAVIALGKLGCRELNYASDIDLLFLYSGAGETAGDGLRKNSSVTNKEFFTQVAQRIVKTISGLATESAVYRVDLRLRPYGRDGDMVWEAERAADYYHKKAENWERQMLIRARASAGDEAVFTKFFALVREVVFSETPHPKAIAHVRRAKEKIDRKMARQSGGFNVKLGIGGIREIEFIAQALQLAHGGREPWLRSAQTLITLARLAEKGYLTEQERTALSSAYTFFRTVEHRVQMEHGAQTHTLPLAKERLEIVARRCSYAAPDAATAFKRDMETQAATVRAIYNRVFAESEEAAIDNADEVIEERSPLDEESHRSTDNTPRADAAHASGVEADFDEESTRLQSQAAMAVSRLLASVQHIETEETQEQYAAIVTAIADAHKVAINPVRSLKNLLLWAESFATYKGEAARMVLQNISDNFDAAIEKLLMVLSSQYLAGILVSRPLFAATLLKNEQPQTIADFRRRLQAVINSADGNAAKADALRHAWNEIIVGIGYRDMRGVKSQESGVRSQEQQKGAIDSHLRASNLEQTVLAEATLQIAVAITLQSFGVTEHLPFAVLGLGRLGHAGMDYGSDLDLLIVFDETKDWDEASVTEKSYGTAQEFYADFTARLLQMLSVLTREGFLYRVDLRLRPEGKNGQLAQGVERLLTYLQARASAWEHSAYLKVREVAGDLQLGATVRQAIIETVFQSAARNDELQTELAAMRKRLETEKAKHRSRDIKWGAGGMTDVYFLTRYLQLRDCIAFPTEAGTMSLIRHLGATGSLPEEAAQTLFDGYSFLRRLDHRMRLLLDRPTSTLPVSSAALADLAASLNFASVEEFEQSYAQYTAAIRTVYVGLFT